MARSRSTPLVAAALLTLAATGCKDDPFVPPQIASIAVTSPVDSILLLGGSVLLTAAATTANGDAVQTQFTWQSSNGQVASVSPSGVVQTLAPGSTTISASAGNRTGELRLRVTDADVAGITALLGDPLRTHLIAPLQSATRTTVENNLTSAGQALSSGNIVALLTALTSVSTQATSATHPDDRALLATLRLLTDHAIRLLRL